MTSKDVLYKRLCTAVKGEFKRERFIWFFHRFCDIYHRPDLITAKQLSTDDVLLFSQYAQYDLRVDNPTPLLPKME